jgi:hypothetical protein
LYRIPIFALQHLVVNESLTWSVFSIVDASEVHVFVPQSNLPLYVECSYNDFEMSIPAFVDEGDVKGLDPPIEVLFAKLSLLHMAVALSVAL